MSASIPSPHPLSKTCQRLMEADQAYDRLVTGRSVREVVDQNGERVSYATANASRLLAYIQQLQQHCSDYQASALPTVQAYNRPLRFLF